jgi:hypothetical protein
MRMISGEGRDFRVPSLPAYFFNIYDELIIFYDL